MNLVILLIFKKISNIDKNRAMLWTTYLTLSIKHSLNYWSTSLVVKQCIRDNHLCWSVHPSSL